MGLFGRGKKGGVMNVIRCDLNDYLVWKWRPLDQEVNSTSRENSIRYGSSLRVKDGEVAVFVYKQKNGVMQDFIVGPYDDTIKTANFPVLSSIVGMAFGGESPFQAEIYFINLTDTIQINFGVPYFDVADPRFMDYVVPVSAGGTITFAITDYRDFIRKNRLVDFSLDRFRDKVKDVVVRRCKSVIGNAPAEFGFPIVQIERKIEDINEAISSKLVRDFEDFGVSVKRLDLSRISPDKESDGWRELRSVTSDIQSDTIRKQSEINLKNMEDMQAINAANMEETLRIQREEAQRAQRLQTESNFMGAHALNVQAEVLKAGVNSLGQMTNMGDGGAGGGLNPVGMMTGMAMGGAMGQQMAGMMNNMGQQMTAGMQSMVPGAGMAGNGFQQGMTPPPMPGMPGMPQQPQAPNPSTLYMLSVNGQQAGPFNYMQLQQLQMSGQLTAQTYVWTQGMPAWQPAGQCPELMGLFVQAAPAQPQQPQQAPMMPPPPPMP
ncbi:MAG: SPFH domain-containing protein [Muribaculaceae bacterium]|nr:SPFH domain-containing protein [Muribaculaceae bacterium]